MGANTFYAAVNGQLELTLLKDRQRFDAISTSNLEVYNFRDWWILTYFIFGLRESSPNNIWSMVNLERTCVLLFYYFLCLKVNLDKEKTKQLGESLPNFIFAVVNLDPIILEKRWIDGESWPNDFVEKVNRGEDFRWVGSRCPLTRALKKQKRQHLGPHTKSGSLSLQGGGHICPWINLMIISYEIHHTPLYDADGWRHFMKKCFLNLGGHTYIQRWIWCPYMDLQNGP